MGKHEKLLAKLTSHPKDFTFQEVTTLRIGISNAQTEVSMTIYP